MADEATSAEVQESLFGELTRGGDGVNSPPETLRTGPGRPKGATNKRTRQYADLIVSEYGSPLQRMAKVYAADTDKLAKRLRCKPVEALGLQLQAARDAAPYVHERRPQAHQVDVEIGALVIHQALPGSVPGGAGSGGYELGEPVDVEVNEINDLPGADPGQSDASQSDVSDK